MSRDLERGDLLGAVVRGDLLGAVLAASNHRPESARLVAAALEGVAIGLEVVETDREAKIAVGVVLDSLRAIAADYTRAAEVLA